MNETRTTDDTPLYTATLIETAAPRVTCPRCDGRGEIAHNQTRDEWGNYDADWLDCGICDGAGDLALDVAAEYRAYLTEMDKDA